MKDNRFAQKIGKKPRDVIRERETTADAKKKEVSKLRSGSVQENLRGEERGTRPPLKKGLKIKPKQKNSKTGGHESKSI